MKTKSNHRKLNIKIIIVLAILIMSFFAVRVVMAANVLLKAEHKEGMNYINLSWNAPDTTKKWSYRLYQKTEGETEFETVSTKYNKPVKVLNIYPGVGDNLQEWMNNYGKGLISVDKVDIEEFNNNPIGYLKDNNGDYKYDVLMFGSWDWNNWEGAYDGDLSSYSSAEVEKFIKSGRGVLFGHDTIVQRPDHEHPNFNKLAKYLKMTPDKNISIIFKGNESANIDEEHNGISVIKIAKMGYLTKYPWNLGELGKSMFVPLCHTYSQIAEGRIWMRFDSSEQYMNVSVKLM